MGWVPSIERCFSRAFLPPCLQNPLRAVALLTIVDNSGECGKQLFSTLVLYVINYWIFRAVFRPAQTSPECSLHVCTDM